MNKEEKIEVASNKEHSFEHAMSELEAITRKLETGNLELDEAIKLYEKGSELTKLCEKKLNSAKLKVEKIVKSADGSVKLEEFSN